MMTCFGRFRSQVLAACIVTAFAGCDDVAWFQTTMDSKNEPTFAFWAAFNGIHYRSQAELSPLQQQMLSAQGQFDLDALAQTFTSLGGGYSAMAQQMERLDPTDVDPDALAFRDRFATFHGELGSLYGRIATATKDRDMAGLEKLNEELKTFHADAPKLSSEKDAVEAKLSERYSRTFDVVDHH